MARFCFYSINILLKPLPKHAVMQGYLTLSHQRTVLTEQTETAEGVLVCVRGGSGVNPLCLLSSVTMGRTGVGDVCLCLCALICLVLGQNNSMINVAPGKTYSQSSKFINQGPSSQAANGNTSGVYGTNCIHTDDFTIEYNPWWQVDLGSTFPVSDVTVWARTNFQHRLYPSTITVDGQNCTSLSPFPSNTRQQTVSCSTVMYGQRVRITRHNRTGESRSDRTLNLCEMQIWVCQDGYYRTNPRTCVRCSNSCPSQSCDRGTGRCNGCVDGHYGNQCEMTCPAANCRRCDQDTGTCLQCAQNSFLQLPNCSECQDGYYSPAMCVRCSVNCLSQICDKETGKCNGCVDGRYGNQCGMTCPAANCRQCDQGTGTCLQCAQNSHLQLPNCTECQDGYYKISPAMCVRCSANCVSQSCDKETGKCNGCVDGRYGDICTDSCPAPNCRRCDQDSGECSQCTLDSFLQPPSCTECQDRFYRTSPAQCVRCSVTCLTQDCEKQTGRCNACVDGRYGDVCTDSCPAANCRQCDQDSGECSQCTLDSFLQPPSCTDCVDGYYMRTPPDNRCKRCTCKSGTVCDKTTGHCPLCPPGKQGDRCDQECEAGRYGENCTGRCGQCLNQLRPGYCDVKTGHCTDGCLDGWQPPLCSEEDSSSAVIIGSAVGAGLFVGISVMASVLIWVFISRKRSRENGNSANETGASRPSTSPRRNPSAQPAQAPVFSGLQDDEQTYEKVDDIPMSTKASDSGGAEDRNPYDHPAVQYQNTGDVQLYDPWLVSHDPQQQDVTVPAEHSRHKEENPKQESDIYENK